MSTRERRATSLAQGVAANIRAEMARQRRSQAALADRLGLSQSQVSKRIRGDLDFGLDELAIVAEFLDLPVAQLLPEQVA